MRSIVVLLCLTSACTMSRSSKTGVSLAGVATTVAGIALVSAGPEAVDSNGDGINSWSGNDDYSMPLFGSVLVIAGLAAVIGGLTAREVPEEPVAAYQVSVPPPVQPAPEPAPVTPARPPLPEVAVDEETLRLAKTLRTVAMHGNCDGAAKLLVEISSRSHAYFEALVTGPVLAPCPQLRLQRAFGSVD